MKQLITSLLFFIHFFSYSQSNFDLLECHGSVPEALKTTVLDNFTKEVEVNETLYNEKKDYRKAKEDMLLRSSLSSLELIKSGNILYGDSLTNYLNSIVDILLQDKPELRATIKV